MARTGSRKASANKNTTKKTHVTRRKTARLRKGWKPLSDASKRHLSATLETALISTLSKVHKDKLKRVLQQELSAILANIKESLNTVTVPSRTLDKSFNVEYLQQANRTLESALLPELEHITRIEAAIETKQRALEEEQLVLEELERQADNQSSPETGKEMHPLLQERPLSTAPASSVFDNALVASWPPEWPAVDEPSLSHLGSMQLLRQALKL